MTALVQAILLRLRGDRGQFVLVNAAVNLLVLARSYVAMRALDYHELGLLAITQSIVLLVGAGQLGILNGGYRMLCAEDQRGARRINDQVYSLIGVLGAVTLVLVAAALGTVDDAQQAIAVAVGGLAGVLTILRSWMVNHLIASVSLGSLNRVNFVSALLSFVVLAAVGLQPLLVCLLSILLQPLAFAIYALYREPGVRPGEMLWNRELVRRLFASGFVVFLTGVLLIINGQLERWSIVASTGTEGLGHFYLALLFVNLYTMVPTSLDALYLPKLVRARASGDLQAVQLDLGKFFALTLAYASAVTLATALLARPIVDLLLPTYAQDLRYVYLVLPGLVVFGLTAPLAIVFNVLIDYRYYFYAYGAGTLATAALLGAVFASRGGASLDVVAVVRTAVNVLMALVIAAGYVAICRRYPEFRFPLLRLLRGGRR
jgi:O-antigen/teichoic acid export membrane protein